MEFLRTLEGLRHPAATAFFSAVTYCGDEIFFMAVAIAVYWCVSKRNGYYILFTGFIGTVCNQFLKLWFRIPRPWVLDPDFTIVENARAAAAGYSFPSGHTQNIVGTMACVWMTEKRTWVRALAASLLLLVPFSRMYLGCHTPLDVGVAFVLALALALGLYPLVMRSEERPQIVWGLLAVSLVLSLLYWGYVNFYRFPVDIDAENLRAGTKNAYTLLGCLLGLIAAKALDDKYIRFRVEAVWWAQILKLVLGLGLLLLLRALLKPLFLLFLPEYPASLVRYFLLVLFAGAGWPLTFPWFSGLGGTKAAAADTPQL